MEILGVAIENLLVGVGAALLVGIAIRVKDITYAKYLERQYPIAGEYITTWEQDSGGETETMSAPATLEQQGKRVVGRSRHPDNSLEWRFEGEISETGYLNGLYYSMDPHNNSIGNFFFHINHDGTLEGLWAGYQQRTDQIQSGRYTFVPVFDAYTVGPLSRRDVPAAVDIAEQRLEKESRSAELLSQSLDSETTTFARVARVDTEFDTERSLASNLTDALLGEEPTVRKNGPGEASATEVLGVALASVVEQETFREQIKLSHTELSKALLHADKVGIIHTVAVWEGFENRGIGTGIVESIIDECVDRGATSLYAVGWETDTGRNIGGLMDYFGFREIARIDGYWSEETREDGFSCDRCQELPCTCTAIIYARYQPTKTG